MDNFVWISGSINSGKSTIAKLLADKIENAVNIELDTLSHFNKKLSIEDKSDFIIEDALILAGNWVNRGSLPILNWPLWGEEAEFMLGYARKLALKPVLINLITDVETLKKDRGERLLTEWEVSRIDYMLKVGNVNQPKYGINIDNTRQTPAETIEQIVLILNAAIDGNILKLN